MLTREQRRRGQQTGWQGIGREPAKGRGSRGKDEVAGYFILLYRDLRKYLNHGLLARLAKRRATLPPEPWAQRDDSSPPLSAPAQNRR